MKKRKNRSILRFFLSSKIIILVGLVFLIFVSLALGKELARKRKVNQQIDEVKQEIERLEKRNKELTSLIEYLNTDSFKEVQARQSLNMQKEGETAVAVPAAVKSAEEENDGGKFDFETKEGKSNLSKWWKYFFEN